MGVENLINMYKHLNLNYMMNLKKSLFAIAIIVSAAACNSVEKADYNVIPKPNKLQLQTTETPFILSNDVTIVYQGNDEMKRNAEFLADYIKETTGIEVKVSDTAKDKDITLIADLEDFNSEAYKIDITANGISVNGASPAGVFRALQTLRKSLPLEKTGKVEMDAVSIYDYPRFSYRGAHLDVSRHFFNKEEVKTYIDMLALHNMNTFHWHLTDDQGWRIEIKKYPKLEEVSSKRKETVIGRLPGKWDGKPHGGWFTQEDAKEIVAYAAERFINVIPEIDMPGHMRAALAAYPEMGCIGGPYDVWTEWGVTEEVLCAGNDKTMQFIADVLNEVMDIFPSQFIHIGGDECPKTRWKVCPKCQARIKAEGIKAKGKYSAVDRLQGYVTHYAYNVIHNRGRKMIGWDEILESDVPQDVIIMSWRGIAGAIEGAKHGNDVILTPNSHLYFDFYQSKDTQYEPFAIGGFIPVEKVYDFEPVPKELSGDVVKHVLGAQCNVWTEYILDFPQVQYMVLPRMAALSEVQWTEPELKDYDSFKDRIPAMFKLYDKYGYNYAKHLSDITATYKPIDKKKALEVNFSTLKGNDIYYTLDGSEPTTSSTKYKKPFNLSENAIIKAAAFRNGVRSRILCDTISTNIASFTKAWFNSTPNENYTFAGAQTLVDGLNGNGNYRTGRWIGFVGNDCDVTIDLGQEVEISEIGFNNVVFQCDGVVDARGVEVKSSLDGKNFKDVAKEEYPDIDKALEFGVVNHIVKFPTEKARYINVIIKSEKTLPSWHGFAGSNGFVFVDEITVK